MPRFAKSAGPEFDEQNAAFEEQIQELDQAIKRLNATRWTSWSFLGWGKKSIEQKSLETKLGKLKGIQEQLTSIGNELNSEENYEKNLTVWSYFSEVINKNSCTLKNKVVFEKICTKLEQAQKQYLISKRDTPILTNNEIFASEPDRSKLINNRPDAPLNLNKNEIELFKTIYTSLRARANYWGLKSNYLEQLENLEEGAFLQKIHTKIAAKPFSRTGIAVQVIASFRKLKSFTSTLSELSSEGRVELTALIYTGSIAELGASPSMASARAVSSLHYLKQYCQKNPGRYLAKLYAGILNIKATVA